MKKEVRENLKKEKSKKFESVMKCLIRGDKKCI